tara:strand:+ start:250 stop:438 length:189 start_codon:yes stop_codon:yes gene_type:complete
MPRNSWFKKLWRWKFGSRTSPTTVPEKTLKRTKRFKSFRRVNDDVPGGYYLDRCPINNPYTC